MMLLGEVLFQQGDTEVVDSTMAMEEEVEAHGPFCGQWTVDARSVFCSR